MNETSLSSILSTEFKVLYLFLDDPDSERFMEELFEGSKIPKTTLKRALDKLVELDILNRRHDGYRTYFVPVRNHLLNQVKILKNLDSSVIRSSIERIGDGSLLLYGSRAIGTNDKESDWDLLLIGDDIDARKINAAVRGIEEETGETINVMILTGDEVESMREGRSTFYLELLRSHHILRGDVDEL